MTMSQDKFHSLLGLASRAGKIVSGEELVVKAIQKGNAYFIVISEDASQNTLKKVVDKCTYYEIPYKITSNRERLGHAIGKHARVVLGVTDQGFSNALERLI